jgi:hypothetical protein
VEFVIMILQRVESGFYEQIGDALHVIQSFVRNDDWIYRWLDVPTFVPCMMGILRRVYDSESRAALAAEAVDEDVILQLILAFVIHARGREAWRSHGLMEHVQNVCMENSATLQRQETISILLMILQALCVDAHGKQMFVDLDGPNKVKRFFAAIDASSSTPSASTPSASTPSTSSVDCEARRHWQRHYIDLLSPSVLRQSRLPSNVCRCM